MRALLIAILALPFGCSFRSLEYLQEGGEAATGGRAAQAGAGGASGATGTLPVTTTAGSSPVSSTGGSSPVMAAAGTAGDAPVAAHCDNDAIGQDETDIDCGGRACQSCATGRHCLLGTDCESGICTNQACQAPSCTDLARNGDETDLNCGGSCGPCATGHACRVGADCETNACLNSLCAVPNCEGATPDADCALLVDNTAYSLRPANAPGSCVDVVGLGVDNGVELQQYACSGRANQTFRALTGVGGHFSLRNVLSGKCLQVRGKSLASGALIEQASCNGESQQLFLPGAGGSAGMKLVIESSGLSLDVAGAVSSNNGPRLVQSVDDGSLDMRWTAVKEASNGFVTLNALGQAGVFLRHVAKVVSAEISLGPDSQWKIEPGLATPACVSFASIDQPGAYLRHSNALLWTDISDGSAIFNKDATFCFRAPLSGADPASHALESFNYPGNYVSSSEGRVRLLTFADTPQFRQLATWVIALAK